MTIITIVCSAAIGGFIGTKMATVAEPVMTKLSTKLDELVKKGSK
jgi:hypothetical protein